jgi:hypothetical protein
MCGTLKVERDGPHVKFSMEFADEDFSHAFSVERYHGMKKDEDKLSPTYGQMIEDWRHVHTGTRKFIRAAHDWKHHHPEDPNPIPHHECTFRALAYRTTNPEVVANGGVLEQVTNGVYSDHVTG